MPTLSSEKPDWNARYLTGDTPWERGSPSRDLVRVLDAWQIRPCRVLELGCGTGNDAVHLARLGFDVTAIDVAPRAIEQAEERARRAGVCVNFLAADFRRLPDLGPPFALVFDSGCYHCVRKELLADLLAFLERSTQPGSLWLTLAGNANEPQAQQQGPPRLRAGELCSELEPLFALVELRETHFETADKVSGWRPLAWSALWRRR